MPTRAFRMTLHPGCKEEYRRRHDALWPELAEALHAAGIEDYRIFLDTQSNALFAVMIHQEAHGLDSLPELAVMKRWWHFMADIMETHTDDSPVEVELEEMFVLRPFAQDKL